MTVQLIPSRSAGARRTAAPAAVPQERAFDALAASIRVPVTLPADPGFDEARGIWNLAHDARPAAIVRPTDASGIARAVEFGRERDLQIAVRGGGHSLAGHGTVEGGLVIDTRGLRTLQIDPIARRARAGAGLTAGEYTAGAHAHGLATPFGDTGSVGLAGITLGGGIGYLARRRGLTVDSLLSAEVVTADGSILTASERSNADLFWALRGGGGNFGVVTSLEFALHPAGTVYGGALIVPPTWKVLRGLASLAAAAPDELTLIANVMPAPPAPFVPADAVGKPVLAILGVFAGDLEAGERALAPFRALAEPIADVFGPMPYPAIYAFTEGAGMPHPSVTRTLFLDAFDDTVIETILESMATATSHRAMIQVRVLGGAVARVPVDSTAFAHRHAPVFVAAMATHVDPASAPADVAWAQAFIDALRPRAVGAYVNFLEDEGEARIREAYPARTYRRLAAVKAAYDPDNVFRRNQNIPPRPEAAPAMPRS